MQILKSSGKYTFTVSEVKEKAVQEGSYAFCSRGGFALPS